MEEVVIEYGSRWYLVPWKITIEEWEHDGRCDGTTIYTDGKEFWGQHWTTSNALDRCGCCGEFYVEFKNCGCEQDSFELSKEQFMEEALKLGFAKEIPVDEGKALQVVQEIKEIQKRISEILSSIENIEIKEVKEFGNSAHVTLSKDLIGRKVLIIPL
jgi:putative transposon-encoded protein